MRLPFTKDEIEQLKVIDGTIIKAPLVCLKDSYIKDSYIQEKGRIIQRSEEWYAHKRGKVSASRISELMAKTKTGVSAMRKNYMMELLCERLTGVTQETYKSTEMLRGMELEELARLEYELKEKANVELCEFIDHPSIKMYGASPDGLVGKDGLIEIKCPNTAQHVAFLQSGKIERKYILQMMVQMDATGRKWCDFVSFDDRFPISYKCIRVMRDEDKIKEIHADLMPFLDELNALEKEFKQKIKEENIGSGIIIHD